MAYDLKDVMKIIRSGEWFGCSVVCADLGKKDGGKIVTYPRARIARRELMTKSGTATSSATGNRRNANHNENFTVNLELQNGQIRKIHPALIYSLNNTPVL